MSTRGEILAMLEECNGIISGQSMAEKIGVSRMAISKNIKALQNAGYSIDTSAKGYKLIKDTDVIEKSSLEKLCNNEFCFEIFDKIDSTNTYIKSIANTKDDGYVVIAGTQTSGKGRLGRSFFSPHGSGIYMSLLLKPKLNINDTGLITAMIALAVCKAIEQELNIACQIKWVNDIYYKNKKISGILCEAGYNMELAHLDYVVIGIGINVYAPENGFPKDIEDRASYILDNAVYNLRNKLIARILKNIKLYYKDITSRDFVKEYIEKSMLIGKNITVVKPNASINARAISIDNDCRLLVEYENKEREYINSGEISIRL